MSAAMIDPTLIDSQQDACDETHSAGDYCNEPDWRYQSAEKLTAYIVERFHRRYLQLLPQLIERACWIEHGYADWPECPHGMALQLWELQQNLEDHLQREQQLFPLLLTQTPAQATIEAMRLEHQEYAVAIERLALLSNDFTAPAQACNTWRALYLGLKELRRDFMRHMHLEDDLLFAAAPGIDLGQNAQSPVGQDYPQTLGGDL